MKIVKVRYPWENYGTIACIPNCSGIPPYVMILAEVEHMRNELKVLRNQIKDDMNSVMDERGVGGNEFHTNSILKAIEASVQKMQDIVSKAVVANSNGGGGDIYECNGSYDGDSAPNAGGVAFIEDKYDDDGGFDFNDCTNSKLDRGEEARALERKKISETKLKLKKRKLTVGFHHGRLQVVPVYWTFPNMTINQLIDNWFIGN